MWISIARSPVKWLICLAIGLALWGTPDRAIADLASTCEVDCVYQTRSIHSADGIGKFYLDREIAKVMGHQEMWWLERSTRQREEQPQQAIEALNLQPTDVVADIGAGTGYFSFRLAQKVPQGKVFAVDVQPEMVDAIAFLRDENRIENVEPILGTQTNPNLPEASIDLALMVDAYHEFAYPQEMMQGIRSGLKPGGRVVLVEYRRENPFVPIKKLHKMSVTQVKKERLKPLLQGQNPPTWFFVVRAGGLCSCRRVSVATPFAQRLEEKEYSSRQRGEFYQSTRLTADG